MPLIDTHCHLSHERFREDLDAVLARAHDAGVTRVVSIASHLDDAAELAGWTEAPPGSGRGGDASPEGRVPRIFATAGIHPHEVGHLPDGPDHDGEVRHVLDRLRALLDHPGVVAVGECGLDFHYDFAPRDTQFRWFDRQLLVAGESGLPVVVHCRAAEDEMIPRVREAGEAGIRGVLHCFPGHLGLLETALDAGWHVSFTGIVTFRSFDGIEAVQQVPAGRYFLETDGPYLAPIPHRGKRNEPAFVPLIRDRVAELRGTTPLEVEESTTAAAVRFFDLPAD
ncbi:MAG: TatD family deoxyribonuclease [Gemmatimonadales bacterium]|nr:MAG: TatD family deoxyribonuclease [Gemmatimonadales bacterium]